MVNKPAYKDTSVTIARSERESLDTIREQMKATETRALELEKLKALAQCGLAE